MLRLLAGPYDPDSRTLSRADGPVRLSPTEARLLEHLSAAPGQAFSKESLLVDVWGYKPGIQSRTLFSTVDRLRKKVEVDPGNPDHVVTIDGGYAFIQRAPLSLSDDLVGRQADAERAVLALESFGARVLLSGPGGVGKSRLAAELTTALVPSHLPRSVRVDLAGVATEADLQHALARALALKGGVSWERIGRVLEARAPLLLVLDDLDHLADASPSQTAELLALGQEADVRVLATCRDHLELPTVTVVPLGALTPSAARTLLARRATAAGFRPDSNGGALGRLGDALDRLPLALELAASWLALVPPEVLMARLDELTGLMDDTERPDHHRSLRACVDWSIDLLTPSHKESLSRLSLWRSPLPADALTALVADLGAPLAIIAELRRRSLVQVGPDGATRLLETVRRALTPIEGCAQRLAPWIDGLLDRADALRFGPRHAEVMLALERAAPLVHEVLDALPNSGESALQIARWTPILLRLGPDPKALERVETARAGVPPDSPLALRLELMHHLLARRFGRPDVHALRTLSTRIDPGSELAVEALLELGIVLRMTGDSASAEATFVEAARHPSATAVQRGRARVELSNHARRQGRLEEARTLLEEVLAEARMRRDPRTRMLARGAMGSVAHKAGEWMEAETHQRKALTLARELREWDNVAHLEGNLANTLVTRDQHSEALRMVRSALAHYREHGHLRSEAYALQTEATIRFALGQISASLQGLEAALDAFRGARDSHGLAYACALRLAITVGSGAYATAVTQAQRSLQLLPGSVGAAQVACLGYIASVLNCTPDPTLLALAREQLPTRPHADALRQAVETVENQPEVVLAWIRDPHWVHSALW